MNARSTQPDRPITNKIASQHREVRLDVATRDVSVLTTQADLDSVGLLRASMMRALLTDERE